MIGDDSTGERVDEQDVDVLIRSARAKIARLALELRAGLREADAAERTAEGAYHDVDGVHGVAREHLCSALASRLAGRRSEMIAEVELARDEAARSVNDARAQAAALVAAAHREPLPARFDDSKAPPTSDAALPAERSDAPSDGEGPLYTNGHRPTVPEPFHGQAPPDPAGSPLPHPASPRLTDPATSNLPDPAAPATSNLPDPAAPATSATSNLPDPAAPATSSPPDLGASVAPVSPDPPPTPGPEAEAVTQPHPVVSPDVASQAPVSQSPAAAPRRARFSRARFLHRNLMLALIGVLLASMTLIVWLG